MNAYGISIQADVVRSGLTGSTMRKLLVVWPRKEQQISPGSLREKHLTQRRQEGPPRNKLRVAGMVPLLRSD